MQILEVSNIKAGQVFPLPLFHQSGRKLLSSNTEMTALHLETLVRTGVHQVFLAESANTVLDHASGEVAPMAVGDLQVGWTAETDLLTPDGVVLVQQNEQVEDHHLAALRDSGVDFVLPRPAADADLVLATLQGLAQVATARLEGQLKRGEHLRAPESQDPLLNKLPRPKQVEVLNLNAVQLMRRRLTSRLQPVYGMLETGKTPEFAILEGIAGDLLDLVHTEPRQFSQLALMTARQEDYLPDHAVSSAVLAMAMATQMGLSTDHVREVVLGALLFDVGMLVVPKRIRMGSGALSEGDRGRIQQHPLLSVSMMEQIPGLSTIPRIMGFQHHERLNGTGYPTGARAEMVSDYARIMAVADIFAAATNPRAYKSSKLPYQAMEELVHLAHKGYLDPRVVKALLGAVGLFPVGSYVVLSNQTQAQVVGANAARIDRPLIWVSGSGAGEIVDLSEARYERVKIVKAVPPPLTKKR